MSVATDLQLRPDESDAFLERRGVGSRRRLALLDEFELRSDDKRLTVAIAPQRLLAFLALHRHQVRRSFVAGILWPESTEPRAGGNLRSAIWRLQIDGRDFLHVTPTHIGLHASVEVDLQEATSLARNLAKPWEPPSMRSLDPRILMKDLLPSWYEDWVVVERERFRLLRVHALEIICDRFTKARMYALAAECGLAAIEADPLRESAHGALIRTHLAEGNRAEAIRRFRILGDLLREDLGVEPSREMARLLWP